ncbi:hypothetical protein BKA81DRAFT_377765 [Phyllosticta paracitricarpa]
MPKWLLLLLLLLPPPPSTARARPPQPSKVARSRNLIFASQPASQPANKPTGQREVDSTGVRQSGRQAVSPQTGLLAARREIRRRGMPSQPRGLARWSLTYADVAVPSERLGRAPCDV